MSFDSHDDIHPIIDHYIGIDVGTGSARACIINSNGDIIGLASENIGLWQPASGHYVCWSESLFASTIAKMTAGTIYYRYMVLHLHVCQAGCKSTQCRC